MAEDANVYLGVAGAMLALEVPERNWTYSLEKFGAVQQGLSGRRTVHNAGFRRTYEMTLPALTRRQVATVEAWYLNATVGSYEPLRLLTPMHINLLSAAASAVRSVPDWSAAQPAFVTTDTVATGVTSVTDDPDIEHYPLFPRLRYSTSLSNITGTNQIFMISGWVGELAPAIAGETYTLSGYVRCPDGSATLSLYSYDRTGTDAGARVLGESDAADGNTWRRVSVTATITDEGQDYLAAIVVLSGHASVTVTGLQLERAAAPSEWTIGTGVPQVAITEMEQTTPTFPRTDVELTIVEL